MGDQFAAALELVGCVVGATGACHGMGGLAALQRGAGGLVEIAIGIGRCGVIGYVGLRIVTGHARHAHAIDQVLHQLAGFLLRFRRGRA